MGRSRGGYGTKLHVLIDELGRLWGLCLSPGQTSDHVYAPFLVQSAAEQNAKIVVGDKGYDSLALRKQINQLGMRSVIPFRKSSKHSRRLNKKRYRQRNIVERFIGRIKENRRVATRYDKTASHFAGFIILAAIKSWLNIIC